MGRMWTFKGVGLTGIRFIFPDIISGNLGFQSQQGCISNEEMKNAKFSREVLAQLSQLVELSLPADSRCSIFFFWLKFDYIASRKLISREWSLRTINITCLAYNLSAFLWQEINIWWNSQAHVIAWLYGSINTMSLFSSITIVNFADMFCFGLYLTLPYPLQVDFSEFSRFYGFVYFICRENGQKNISEFLGHN